MEKSHFDCDFHGIKVLDRCLWLPFGWFSLEPDTLCAGCIFCDLYSHCDGVFDFAPCVVLSSSLGLPSLGFILNVVNMCLKKRFVTNRYTGMQVLVDCGSCPACQQKKRNYQKFLFGNNSNSYVLFVTLTYNNISLPYVILSEVEKLRSETFFSVPVYRGNKYLDSLSFNGFESSISLFQHCSIIDDFKVGVLYQRDFSNFFKRLRKSLLWHHSQLSYFYATEYGSTFQRPHIHIAFFISIDEYEIYRSAIIKAWSFCDWDKLPINECFKFVPCSSTKSYISSYLNKCTNLPLFLQSKPINQKVWHSNFFGFGMDAFRFDIFFASAVRHKVTFTSQSSSDSSSRSLCLYPKYVVNRYFPKIKGFSRLSYDDFCFVYKYGFTPKYCRLLEYSDSDIRPNMVLINRCKSFASVYQIDYDFFLMVFFQFYVSYACYLIKSVHFDEHGIPLPFSHLRTCYDNLSSFLKNDIERRAFGFNPNFTDSNLSSHNDLVNQFNHSLFKYSYKSIINQHG